MGHFLDFEARLAPKAKGSPAEVGEVSLTRQSSATLLVPKSNGRWAYGEEVDLEVSLNHLEIADLPNKKESLFWSGITIRIDPANLPQDNEGAYRIFAALDPPSLFWFAQAPLRPTYDTFKPAQRTAQLQRLAEGTMGIDELSFDPFEQNEGWQVARLGDPLRPHWQQETTEDLGAGLLVDRSPNRSTKKRKWFFALCPQDPAEILQALTQQMQPFMEDVLSGRISVQPRKQRGKAASAASLGFDWQDYQQMGQLPKYKPQEDAIGLLLEAAIRQALAGRERDSQRSLEATIRNGFIEHLRNTEQRLWIQDLGVAKTRNQLEHLYRDFILAHPECDCFRQNFKQSKRLRIDWLGAKNPDPAIERCRRLWIDQIRAAGSESE